MRDRIAARHSRRSDRPVSGLRSCFCTPRHWRLEPAWVYLARYAAPLPRGTDLRELQKSQPLKHVGNRSDLLITKLPAQLSGKLSNLF